MDGIEQREGRASAERRQQGGYQRSPALRIDRDHVPVPNSTVPEECRDRSRGPIHRGV